VRILLLTQFFPPDYGGEEWHVLNLANALAARKHDVAVATQRVPAMPDEEVLPSGVRVYRFSTAAMRVPAFYATGRAHHPPVPDPLGVRELRGIIRRFQPEVVHAHNWSVNSALPLHGARSASRRFGLVLTLHDFSHVCATKRFMRNGAPCEGPSLSRCLPCATRHYRGPVGPFTVAANYAMRQWKRYSVDHVISVSSIVARINGVQGLANSSVIPNFIADAALANAPEPGYPADAVPSKLPLPTAPFLLFVGDLCEEKGVLTLLRAYDSLPPSRPPLVLIGKRRPDTPDSLPSGAEMHFDWPHEHVMEAFRRCLLAVLPSVWPDPCPTTVLEAMASGRPVVTTQMGGIVDMVTDGESGLVAAPGNDESLAAAMMRLLDDGDLRGRLAAGAYARARSFTVSAVVDRLEDIYRRAARSHGDLPELQRGEVTDLA
jgi:glycosyltransferase involved in cell wall biosynthesis